MSGFLGLGVSKATAIPKSGGVYTLQANNIVSGEYTITEEILNKTVLCKTSITNYYIAIFLTDIGNEGDFITFKNVEDQKNMYDLNLADTINASDDAYLEFYGVGYSGDIFVPQIWGHFIQYNDTEITFVKEGAKWRRLNSTGLSKLQSDQRPVIEKNALLFFNNRAIVFEGELAFQKGAKGDIFSRENVLRIYQNYTSFEKPLQPYPTNAIDIGTLLLRFKTLYAQNGDFTGTVKAADPVDATDLVNKQYLENNLNPAFLYDELDEMFISNDDLYLDGWNIKDLGDPFELQDAATKNYVDNELLAKGAKLFPRFRSKLTLPLGSVSGSIYTENDLTGIAKLKPVDELDILKSCFSDGNKGYIDGWNNPKMVGIINFKTPDRTTFQQVKVHLCKRDAATRTVLKTKQLNVQNNYRSEITFEFDLVGYIQATYNWYYLELEPVTANTIADIEFDVEYFIK